MKKFLLSAFTIFTFAIYIVYQRMGWGSPVIVTPPIAGQNQNSQSQSPGLSGKFRDGVYNGISADAFYGRVEVVATISGGRIVDVNFLDYPKDAQNSRQINSRATPMLRSEAISTQSAQVDIVSGATETSKAFRESLASALSKAKL